jgi:3-oxoacyl-[acyl-carrier protein] reductase
MNNKFLVVTGASTGIGRETAVELTKLGGVTSFLVARKLDKLQATKKLVEEAGGQAEIFQADLSDTTSINNLIAKIKSQTQKVDAIINIAGVWHGENEVYVGCDFANFDQKTILETYMVGFVAPTLLIHGLLPIMPARSQVINLSGTFENGAKGWLPYFASKRALEDLTIGLTEELKDKGILVNGISPSDTATEEYIKYFPEDAKNASSPNDVAKLIVKTMESRETGKVVVIKKGQVSEKFHL